MFNDEIRHVLLVKIKHDLFKCKETVQSKDKVNWENAIDDELKCIEKNNLWKIVDRPTRMSNGQK